ncbi:MAG: enoyl-CoA hydratase-related protein [Polyangiales bacterium]
MTEPFAVVRGRASVFGSPAVDASTHDRSVSARTASSRTPPFRAQGAAVLVLAMSDSVLVERLAVPHDPPGRSIGRVTLNRPQARNARTRPMLQLAQASVDALGADPSGRCIVVTGTGEGDRAAFCAGADLRKGFEEDPDLLDKLDEYIDDFHGFIKAIWNAPKPVVARVDGGAVGFGCDVALACDLRVVSRRGYFQESFTKIGLMPDGGGTGTLMRLVGLGVASELIYLAPKIEADRALQIGLATRIAADGELDAVTLQLATQLADGPPIAFAETKKALHASLGSSIDDILARERAGQLRCLRTNDGSEGVMSGAQKRAPQFSGK